MASGAPKNPPPRRPAPGSQLQDPSAQLVLPGDRPPEIVRFDSEMVALFADAAALLGVPKSVAAVYGILFASPEPLSFSEISGRVNFSNGSVSQALKALREIGAIRVATFSSPFSAARSQISGFKSHFSSARASFEPDTEMRRLIQQFLEKRLETQLNQGERRLVAMEGATVAFAAHGRKLMEQRLHKLRRWHDRTRALMPLMKTILNLSGK